MATKQDNPSPRNDAPVRCPACGGVSFHEAIYYTLYGATFDKHSINGGETREQRRAYRCDTCNNQYERVNA